MSQGDNVVWILGAGFSQSLGAPLLPDLFSRESARRAAIQYKHYEQSAWEWVAKLCQAGSHGPSYAKPVERQWQHAEEFLERLELAVSSQPVRSDLAKFFERLVDDARASKIADQLESEDGIKSFQRSALQLLVAEIYSFLENADPTQERWVPYRRWAQRISVGDVILTFNYDRVLEMLVTAFRSPIVIPVPEQLRSLRASSNPREKAEAYKLHGSIDWRQSEEGPIRADGNALLAPLDATSESLAIATPGPRKRAMVDKDGPLGFLWEQAALAIRVARAIVFVGYRIPPSDAYTREWLTDQIRENALLNDAHWQRLTSDGRPLGQPLYVHTVLGDDLNHRDSRRLKGLLEALSPPGRIQVKQWPMFAEDFLGTVYRESLFDPVSFRA